MRRGILLFAHGARDPRWAEPFEAVAAHVRGQRADVAVRLAFLELMTPDLATAAADLVAEGCVRIDVVPLFLGAGGHVRKDLPALLHTLRERHTGAAFVLHDAVGNTSIVIEAMATAAISATA
jgi:sirohydrochlorin cobaltochelatase